MGGSTARSGGALWLPASPVLREAGANDTAERAATYLDSVVAGSAPRQRSAAFLAHVPATVEMLRRTTPLRLFWARDYSDYHPEEPGGSAAGRTCECHPLDTSILGEYRTRLRPGVMEASVPMPTTGADYRWMNLVARVPRKGIPTFAKRIAQGVGGLLLGRRYAAGGQALVAGLFAGVLRAGIPVWTDTTLLRLDRRRRPGDRRGRRPRWPRGDDHRPARRGAGHRRFRPQHGHAVEVPVRVAGRQPEPGRRDQYRRRDPRGAGNGRRHRSDGPGVVVSRRRAAARQGARGDAGRTVASGLPDRGPERPRFANESADYMSFGQRLLELERSGSPVEAMWIIFDQQYRNSYVFGAELFPRMRIPQAWYDAGIAVRADSLAELAAQDRCSGIGVHRRR